MTKAQEREVTAEIERLKRIAREAQAEAVRSEELSAQVEELLGPDDGRVILIV